MSDTIEIDIAALFANHSTLPGDVLARALCGELNEADREMINTPEKETP